MPPRERTLCHCLESFQGIRLESDQDCGLQLPINSQEILRTDEQGKFYNDRSNSKMRTMRSYKLNGLIFTDKF